ncbi:MAG: sensor histidine kinase [Alphaproteobacteria bacterium]|nr:MAG: sensor histidine kinase [Alphaproteobacteria bacterium]
MNRRHLSDSDALWPSVLRSGMTYAPPADGGNAMAGNRDSRVRLQTLVGLRWLAILGQALAVLAVAGWLRASMPLFEVLATIMVSAVLNGYLSFRYAGQRTLTQQEAAFQLAFDLAQLSLLLYLTGGICNPFSMLMMVPVTVSATVLARRTTLMLLALALVLSLAITLDSRPLPWPAGETPPQLDDLYLVGLWVALATTMVFLTLYASRVTAEARQRSHALHATREALEKEQRLADLGALAAATAHELGTPLGTIVLTLKDLLSDIPDDSPWREDLELVMDQVQRCRCILERLRSRELESDHHPFDVQPVEALLREAVRPHEERAGVEISITCRPHIDTGKVKGGESADRKRDSAGPAGLDGRPGEQPRIARRPEILHALNNFIENAISFAESRIALHARWNDRFLVIRIEDDGPGFPSQIRERLGEPYVTTRRPAAGVPFEESGASGLGLGIFIAVSLLERTGARVKFANRRSGGAVVEILWPRGSDGRFGSDWRATHGVSAPGGGS